MVDDPQSANQDSPESGSDDDSPSDPFDAPSGASSAAFSDDGFESRSGGNPFDEDPFSDDPFGDDAFTGSDFGGPSEEFGGGSMAVEMARFWIEDNQRTAMIGAFAVGAFLGAMMRD